MIKVTPYIKTYYNNPVNQQALIELLNKGCQCGAGVIEKTVDEYHLGEKITRVKFHFGSQALVDTKGFVRGVRCYNCQQRICPTTYTGEYQEPKTTYRQHPFQEAEVERKYWSGVDWGNQHTTASFNWDPNAWERLMKELYGANFGNGMW